MLESLGVGFSLVEKVQAGYQVFDNFLSFVEFLVFFYNSPEKFAAAEGKKTCENCMITKEKNEATKKTKATNRTSEAQKVT